MTLNAVSESSPVVGSSKNISDGFVINSTPIDVLFLSPPDIPLTTAFPTLVSAHFSKPSSLITDSTFSNFSYSVPFNLIFAANYIASLGVNIVYNTSSYYT